VELSAEGGDVQRRLTAIIVSIGTRAEVEQDARHVELPGSHI
jgi:hypothetical protein